MTISHYGWLVRTSGRKFPRQFLVAVTEKDAAAAQTQKIVGPTERVLSVTRVDSVHLNRLRLTIGEVRELSSKKTHRSA